MERRNFIKTALVPGLGATAAKVVGQQSTPEASVGGTGASGLPSGHRQPAVPRLTEQGIGVLGMKTFGGAALAPQNAG
jgi:hypothetical protein